MANWWEFWKPKREETNVEAPQQQAVSTPRQQQGTTRTTPRTGAGLYYFAPTSNEAMAVATVYRCVQLLSDSVAGLHLQYMKLKGGRYQEDTNSPLHYLLTVQPQPEMSIFDFWSMAVKMMLLDGNAYIFPRKVRGEITDLVLCGRNTVGHDPLNCTYTICDAYNGVYGTFKESEIIHLYLHSSDGRTGESVLSHARRTVGIAGAGDVETANRFTNGGNVRGIVSNGTSTVGFGEYADEELEKTAEDIDGRFSNGEHIVSLPGQVDFKQISLSSTDMQFLDSRKFTVRELCRFFGVHRSFVFDDTSNNYKSAEMANITYLSFSLDPILKRIEAEFCRKLTSAKQCCTRIFKFDRKGIYSLDLLSLAKYQAATIASGVYTVNDWRDIENQPRVEGGDVTLVSANLIPLNGDKFKPCGANIEETKPNNEDGED